MADDQLFLLEVLVDQIKFTKIPCFTDHDFKTCVSFQFLENAPVDICDSDGGGSTYSPDPAVKNMKNGKSCLFALKQSDIAKAKNNFLLNLSVYKTLPCSCLPQNVPVGKCSINMSKEFSEVAQQAAASPDSPGSQSLKDSFPIKNDAGEETGQLNLFLRINCFGKIIVTGFQVADAEAAQDRSIFEDAVSDRAACNPKKDWKAVDDPCFCAKSGQSRQSEPCTAGSCTKDVEEFFPPTPCQVGNECYCSGPPPNNPIQYPMACRDTEAYCLHVPQAAPKQNKIIFQAPENCCPLGDHTYRTHLKYNSDHQGRLNTCDPGCKVNCTNQVFKMRVARMVQLPDRKSNMEITLVTPQMGQPLPKANIESREVQCSSEVKQRKKKKIKKGKCKF